MRRTGVLAEIMACQRSQLNGIQASRGSLMFSLLRKLNECIGLYPTVDLRELVAGQY